MARKRAPPTRKKKKIFDTSIGEMNAMRGDMTISGHVSKILNRKVLNMRMLSVCFEIWVSDRWQQSFRVASAEALQRSVLRGLLTMTL